MVDILTNKASSTSRGFLTSSGQLPVSQGATNFATKAAGSSKTCDGGSSSWRWTPSADPLTPTLRRTRTACNCDGSTSYGAGVHIAGRERAFPLHRHLQGHVDIKTVEALSLELAVLYLAHLGNNDTALVVYSDSTPVCGAFKKGRMAAEEANSVLERIAELEQQHRIRLELRWVKSEDNKADRPSRGKHSPAHPGDRPGEEDPDPDKNKIPERTHATEATAVPTKAKPWAKLAKQWKTSRQTCTKPGSVKAGTKKGPSISTRTFKAKSRMVKTSVTANRPKVKRGPDRFSAWIPASSVKISRATRASLLTVRKIALAGYAKGTHKSYSIGLAQWHRYCDEHKVAEKRREPAASHLVEHWVAVYAGKKRGSYLSDWISALKAWHLLNNLPWLPIEGRLSLIRRGVANLQPEPRPPREPMTVQWLDKLVLAADANDPTEAAVVAAAATGFWGLCRLGELVSSADKAERAHQITRSKAVPSMAFGAVPTYTLRLPRTKTQPQGDTVIIAHQSEICDPIKLMRLHLERSPCTLTQAQETTPLFAYRTADSLQPLTRSKFLSTLGAIGKRAGIGLLQGHSMRIGGCTALLTRGVPPSRVQLHGRWSSDAFKRYIREHAAVMTSYLVINQVASDRLHSLYPTEWPALAPTTPTTKSKASPKVKSKAKAITDPSGALAAVTAVNTDGPTPPTGPIQPSRARGRRTSPRTPKKQGTLTAGRPESGDVRPS
ncbi:hypothetical protein CF336_g3037 [Tilletia laevis]|nr:hypothetical protein CF336_g3037 [Tilletia laevis]KAE8205349.1 hypothetical protein CF335_g2332 [Tilletia laevis]